MTTTTTTTTGGAKNGDGSGSGSGSDDGAGTAYSTRTTSTIDATIDNHQPHHNGDAANGHPPQHLRRRRADQPPPANADSAPAPAEPWPPLGAVLRRQAAQLCRAQTLLDRLPIIRWARGYQLSYVYADFMAGLTVGLTAIPQGIAYAVVAGLEPQYGLYSELLASFVYCVLGSCRNVTIGPTAIMALMVQRYALMSVDFAVFASFCSGCLVLALGMLNLGFLVQFISLPVTAGFTTAAALQIGSLQVKSLLGLPGRSTEFLDAWIHVFRHLAETRLWDAVLGVATIAFLLAFKQLGDIRTGRYASACKYVSLARNALAVLIGSVIAYTLTADGSAPPFALTGPIRAGFPPFGPPPFQTHVQRGNETVLLGTGEMLATMGSSLVAIPFVAILEIVVVAKAFADGKTIDATQELIALGCCNIAGSFVQAMPVTGSFTRTAVNNASGVRTPFGGIITGLLVLLSVGFLTDTFQYIPKATLAAVIITAMFFMMEFGTARVIWRTRRLDLIPFVCTMVACLLLGLDYGICIGIAVNLAFILYTTARPHTRITQLSHQSKSVGGGSIRLLLVQPDQSLVFSAAEHLRAKVLRHVGRAQLAEEEEQRQRQQQLAAQEQQFTVTHLQDAELRAPAPVASPSASAIYVLLDGAHVRTIDVTVARNLQQLLLDLRALGVRLVFWRWPAQPEAVAMRMSRQLGARFWRRSGSSSADERRLDGGEPEAEEERRRQHLDFEEVVARCELEAADEWQTRVLVRLETEEGGGAAAAAGDGATGRWQ